MSSAGGEPEPLVEISRKGATALVLLNRPRVLNAINPQLLLSLRDALEDLAADDDVRVVVLSGQGRGFSAGVDLNALKDQTVSAGAVGNVLDGPARQVTALLAGMPKVTIARVHGVCFTGALELALACDLMVVAEDARLGDTHARWGLRPTWGMSQRLIRTVGPTRARDLSYTAREFTGTEAAQWQLAAQAVPPDDLEAVVAGIAERITANSAGSIAAYKDLYRLALDVGLSEGLAHEATATFDITDTEQRLTSFSQRSRAK